ncbi:MAG TPA: alpha-amylase family protein [Deinococcales bacterium]|nr:alpha-amylase family protein [Deinococcales bacterium]
MASPVGDPVFAARLERYWPELLEGLRPVYGRHPGFEGLLERLRGVLVEAHAARSDGLRALDLRRMLSPDWFERPGMIGYQAYTERFAGSLNGVRERVSYLKELGVTYLHLMPLLEPRPAPNDGGYAVRDFDRVRGDLGSMDDLEALAGTLRENGISLCLDLVINHVAREHEWAERARAGEETFRDYFHTFPDRELPDQYERSLPEIFPETAPGNFTWDEQMGRWVWTTFNRYQWDLNWANPDVFLEFVRIITRLANRGVEVFRLDAIAFIWKRMGTNCQNLPPVHAITQALRAAARIVAPAVIFKAEAIVAPSDLIHYLGRGAHWGLVSDIAYQNSVMVQVWSSLASRDARLFRQAIRAFPDNPPSTSWIMYIRCHDDIGWAVADSDAAAVGWTGDGHRRFLSDYYSGAFPRSFARGLVFQENPRTGDRRICGSTASLIGLERALQEGDERGVNLAVERILMGHAIIFGFGGIPSIYMGDELATLNDYGYERDPAHVGDNRWVQRPIQDWERAERRHNPRTLEGRVFQGLQALARARQATPHLHAATHSRAVNVGNDHVLGLERHHPLGLMLQLYNFSEDWQGLSPSVLWNRGFRNPVDRLSGERLHPNGSGWVLPPYARVWITDAPEEDQ